MRSSRKNYPKVLLIVHFLLLLATVSLSSVRKSDVVTYLGKERHSKTAGSKIRLSGMGTKNFFNTDLSGIDLSNVDFSQCELGHVNFSQCNLRGVVFQGTDLYHTDFSHTALHGIDFTGCDLRSATFDHADLTGSTGFGALSFGSISAKSANLSGLDLSQMDLSGIDLTGADLSSCDLSFSRLRGSSGILLKQAKLTGTVLLDINDAKQQRSVSSRGAIVDFKGLANALREGISYKHISFRSFIFQNHDLSGVDFSGYRLRYSQFLDCDLSNVKFHKTKLIGSSFEGSALAQSDFTQAECDHVNFRKTNLDGANFTDTSLYRADFTEATGEPTPSLDELIDQSDYHWHKFWDGFNRFLVAIFPVAWCLTALFYVIYWLCHRKTISSWLHTVAALTLFVYVIFLFSFTGQSLSGLITASILCLVFIGFQLCVGFFALVNLIHKKRFIDALKHHKSVIAYFICNLLMLYWLLFFAGMIFASV